MRFLCQILMTVTTLLSAVGFLGCVAGIAGIWMFHQGACEKVAKATARIDVGLQRASLANQKAQHALEQACTSVDQVSKESAALQGSNESSRRATRALQKLIRQRVEPNINDLGVRLATLADAAIALASLLQSVQELSPGHAGRIQPDKLEDWTERAEQLATTLRRLETVIGDEKRENRGAEVDAASSAVGLALQRCQARIDDWQSDLEAVREEVRYLQREITGWLMLAAITGSLLCGWMAMGQVSLFAHAIHWLRSSSRGKEEAPT